MGRLGFNVEVRTAWTMMHVSRGDIAALLEIKDNIATLYNPKWKYDGKLPFYLNEFVILDAYTQSDRYKLRKLAEGKVFRQLSLNSGYSQRYFSEMTSKGRFNRRGDMSDKEFERLKGVFGL